MKLDISNGNLQWKSENRAKNIKKIIKELKKINGSENLINLLSELKKYNENKPNSFPKNYTLEKINHTLKWGGHQKINNNQTLHNLPLDGKIPKRRQTPKTEKIIFWNVDTQKDFMNEGGKLKVQDTDKIKNNLKTITNLAKQNNITVVNTCDYHNKHAKEISEAPDFINTFPAHCMEHTSGAEFIKETKPENPLICDWKDSKINTYKIKTTRNIVIRKDAFDVFKGNPHTDKIVKLLAPNKVIVYGVTTNYCVNFAVLGLRQRNIPVYAVIDAMKEIPLEGEPNNTLNNWKNKGVILIQTKDINSLL